MAGDDSAYFPLVLWTQLLVVAAVGVVWIRHRVGRWQSWVIGVQVLGSLGLVVATIAPLCNTTNRSLNANSSSRSSVTRNTDPPLER